MCFKSPIFSFKPQIGLLRRPRTGREHGGRAGEETTLDRELEGFAIYKSRGVRSGKATPLGRGLGDGGAAALRGP